MTSISLYLVYMVRVHPAPPQNLRQHLRHTARIFNDCLTETSHLYVWASCICAYDVRFPPTQRMYARVMRTYLSQIRQGAQEARKATAT